MAVSQVGNAQKGGWRGVGEVVCAHFLSVTLFKGGSQSTLNITSKFGARTFRLPASTHTRELGLPDRDVEGIFSEHGDP